MSNKKSKEDLNSLSNFKIEILNSLSQMEDKIKSKISIFDSYLHHQIESFQNTISNFQSTINTLTEKTTKIELQSEQFLNSLPQIKSLSENIITSDIKLNNLEKEFEKACIKYDKIIQDNLKVHGVIGDFCKYKSIKDYINSTISDICSLKHFKEKINYDLKNHNQNFLTLNSKLEALKVSNGAFVNERLNIFREEYDKKINEYMQKISEVKCQNLSCYKEMCGNFEQLKQQTEKLESIKNVIKTEYEEYIVNLETEKKKFYEEIESVKDNFNQIENQFKTLYEFMKDVRFKKNINKEISKNEIKNIINNIKSLNEKMDFHQDQSLLERNETEVNLETCLKLKEANNFLCSASNAMIPSTESTMISVGSNKDSTNGKLPFIQRNKSMKKSYSSYKLGENNYSHSKRKSMLEHIDVEKQILGLTPKRRKGVKTLFKK